MPVEVSVILVFEAFVDESQSGLLKTLRSKPIRENRIELSRANVHGRA